MAKSHRRSRSCAIQLSETSRAHVLPASDWHSLVDAKLATVVREDGRERVARLSPKVFGFVRDGELIVVAIGPSIRSSWQAFEREFYFSDAPNWNDAPELSREVNDRILRESRAAILRQRENDIHLDCLMWKFHMGRKGKNEITFLTEAQANEVLTALRPAA